MSIEERVKKIVEDQFGRFAELNEKQITNESSFIDDFEVDFMDISSLFIVIEEEFNIDIGLRIEADGYDDDEKFIEEKIPTVQALIDYISANESDLQIEEEEEEVYEAEEYDGLLVDLRSIKEGISKGDLFDEFNVLDSEFDTNDFNKEGFYQLGMDGDELQDMEFLGTEYLNADPVCLKNEMMGINYSDELEGDDIIQLKTILEPNKISVQCFPDPDHWQHQYWFHYVKLNPYI